MIYGNITTTICDHLPQLLLVPNVLSKALYQKPNIYEKDWSKLIHTEFVLCYFHKDWSDVLQLNPKDANLSIESFLDNMDTVLDKHAPLKWINKYKLMFKSKPWITLAQEIHTKKKIFIGNIKITEIC